MGYIAEQVPPLRIHDNESGEAYELDFSRDSVVFAEQRGFKTEDVLTFPATKIPEFWFYAFRKNHKGLARTKTDAILQELGGVTPPMLERLMLLYQQAVMANNVQDSEDLEKNSRMTVEL